MTIAGDHVWPFLNVTESPFFSGMSVLACLSTCRSDVFGYFSDYTALIEPEMVV